MPQALAGQIIGQYQVVEKIGAGGMASVYKALQPSLSRYVALKILSPELAQKDPNFAKRFEVKARAVAALEHPHILLLYDFGAQNGLMYIAMRLVEGGTLTTLMLQQPLLPNNQIVKIIGDIAGALDYAHQQGIVHRDIKPGNILIDRHGEVQLTDFGLARVISAPHQTRLTNLGTVVGTASYMSPEQAADEAIDGRSDNPQLKAALGDPLDREVSGNDTTIEIYSEGTVFSVPIDNQIWVLRNNGQWQRY